MIAITNPMFPRIIAWSVFRYGFSGNN